MKSVVGALKLELSQYEEVARFARFGTEVNEATKRQIERGQRLEALWGRVLINPFAWTIRSSCSMP